MNRFFTSAGQRIRISALALVLPMAQMVKHLSAMQETWVRSLGWEDPWRRERLPTRVFWPGDFHGLYSLRGRKELDTTEHFHSLNILECLLEYF